MKRSTFVLTMATVLLSSSAALAQCPASGSCFSTHGTPGCDDADCCNAVCAADPFCCDTQWDGLCVSGAEKLCLTCGGEGAGSCFVTGSPACNDESCCDAVCSADPFCCDTAWDSLCVGAAKDLCTCGGSDTGSCFTSHGNPWCNDADCCNAVCSADPFCCSASWDGLCVDGAEELCQACGGDGAGSCFTSGSAACNDAECCDAVCAADPFCCSVAWDGICVGGAEDICATCGGAGAGSCFSSGGAFCNDAACCNAVCAADPFCCSVAWDGLCVAGANDLCNGACDGDLNGDNVVNAADLAVLLGAWGGGGAADIDGNGTVNAGDLAILLGAWGNCP